MKKNIYIFLIILCFSIIGFIYIGNLNIEKTNTKTVNLEKKKEEVLLFDSKIRNSKVHLDEEYKIELSSQKDKFAYILFNYADGNIDEPMNEQVEIVFPAENRSFILKKKEYKNERSEYWEDQNYQLRSLQGAFSLFTKQDMKLIGQTKN